MSEALIRDSGDRVVVRSFQGGGDVENAWDVFASVVGARNAESRVRAAAAVMGEDPEAVLEAAYRKRLRGAR